MSSKYFEEYDSNCEKYVIKNRLVSFSQDSKYDDLCLCHFPHDYFGRMDKETVRSLALLGAVVVLIHRDENFNNKYELVPEDLPKWISREIDRRLK